MIRDCRIPARPARVAIVRVAAQLAVELVVLRELGAVKAYARAKALHPKSVSLNLLCGLAAGLGDRDWRELSSSEKVRLKGEAAKAMRFPWGVGLRLRPPSAMLINVRDGIWLRAAT